MEILFEFIGELFFEGAMELINSKKVPKVIRYSLLFIIVSFYLLIIGIIAFIGIKGLLSKDWIVLITFILIDILLIFFLVSFIRKVLKNA